MTAPFASRLDRLYDLAAQLLDEIADEEARQARIRRNREAQFAARPGMRRQFEQEQRRRRQVERLRKRLEDGRPHPKVVRDWAREHGYEVGERGRLPAHLYDAYRDAQLRASA